MMSEHLGVRVEVWPLAADELGIWLLSGDPWCTPRVPADSEPHAELELLLLEHGMPRPLLLHSTSWRPEGAAIVLTYAVVIPVTDLVRGQWPEALPVSTDLLPAVGNPPAHGAADIPVPRHVDVLHHGLRHLTMLMQTDASARDVLTDHWATHLAQLEPALAGMYLS